MAGHAEENACREWRLTASQVEQFFQLSERYKESPYSVYYQIPCVISGELLAEGRTWKFHINGGATATWKSDDTTVHWGCHAKACASLVILPTDMMDPDAQ